MEKSYGKRLSVCVCVNQNQLITTAASCFSFIFFSSLLTNIRFIFFSLRYRSRKEKQKTNRVSLFISVAFVSVCCQIGKANKTKRNARPVRCKVVTPHIKRGRHRANGKVARAGNDIAKDLRL